MKRCFTDTKKTADVSSTVIAVSGAWNRYVCIKVTRTENCGRSVFTSSCATLQDCWWHPTPKHFQQNWNLSEGGFGVRQCWWLRDGAVDEHCGSSWGYQTKLQLHLFSFTHYTLNSIPKTIITTRKHQKAAHVWKKCQL